MTLADHPEVDVIFIPGLPVRGLYAPSRNAIAIRAGQTRRVRRSVLAEELGHHRLGHRPTPHAAEVARMEVRASRWAARHLITVAGLAAAVRGAASWDEAAETLDVDLLTLKVRLGCLTDQERQELRRRCAGFEVL